MGFILISAQLDFPLVCVVDDPSSSESFLLVDEILVEILARIFCGFAEVEVWDIPWAFVEDKVEEGIQSSQFLAQFVGSDILGMNYLGGSIYDASTNNRSSFFTTKQRMWSGKRCISNCSSSFECTG